jgi:phage/plasmid-associated DNA primase
MPDSSGTGGSAVFVLNEKHLEDLCTNRKLNEEWVKVNCKSISKKQASDHLGYSSQSEGIWLQGYGIQGQFKPDKPWLSRPDKSNGKQKAPKYRSPQDYDGDYDAILVNSPTDSKYWADLEALKAKAWKMQGEPCLLITEGVFKAIAGCSNDIPTVALLGVEMGLTSAKADLQGKRYLVKSLERLANAGFGFVLAFDADCATNENVQWAQKKLGRQLRLFGVPVWSITGAWQVDNYFANLNKGMDDYIANYGADRFKQDVLRKAITFENWLKQLDDENELLEKFVDVEESYTQKAEAALYADQKYVAIDGTLHKWVGTHYQELEEEYEQSRIAEWCMTTPVEQGRGRWKFAYASGEHINGIWAWILKRFSVPSRIVNQGGLNTLSGIVRIHWNDENKRAAWTIDPHDPKDIFTYVSPIKVDKSISHEECDRLLECLEPGKRDILIKTLAASLDLENVRARLPHRLRALLAIGSGSNGKNALRFVMEILFKGALTDATLADFQAFDAGNKNELAKLRGSLLNWSSENSEFATLDKIQSLKNVITGDPIYLKLLYKEQKPVRFQTVCIFNMNNAPQIIGGSEATETRFAILKFNKTFADNPDPAKGQLKADPRFCYSRKFVEQQVAPALLIKLLNALETLCEDGIDYNAVAEDISEIKEETDHFWKFIKEVGIVQKADSRIYLKDLWQQLRQWYIEQNTLEVYLDRDGREKNIWHDQVRKGDKNVTRDRDLIPRLKMLFPKIKDGVQTGDKGGKGRTFIEGLAFQDTDLASLAPAVQVLASPPPETKEYSGEAQSLAARSSEAKPPEKQTNNSASDREMRDRTQKRPLPNEELTGGFHLKGKKYEPEPPAFEAGELVIFEDDVFVVESTNHAVAQLVGRRYAVPCWQCISCSNLALVQIMIHR